VTPERGPRGRFRSSVACGRKFCRLCKRWRLLIDFPPHIWADETKTTIRYTQPECRSCRRTARRKEYQSLPPVLKRARVQSSRVWHRRDRRRRGIPERGARVTSRRKPGAVRREPFAAWLKEKVDRHGTGYVARKTKLPERRILAIIQGYDTTGKWRQAKKRWRGRKGKLRPVDHVLLDTVDRALLNWGETPAKLDELYPPEDDP
jgi:hypothetical protein